MTKLPVLLFLVCILVAIVEHASGYGHMRFGRPRSMGSCSCRCGGGGRRFPRRYVPRMRMQRRRFVRARPTYIRRYRPRNNQVSRNIMNVASNVLTNIRRTAVDVEARRRQERETRRLREETNRLREQRRIEEQRRIDEDRRRRQREIDRVRNERIKLENERREIERIRTEKIRRQTIIDEERRKTEDLKNQLRIERERQRLVEQRHELEKERIRNRNEIERMKIKNEQMIRNQNLKNQIEIERLKTIRNTNNRPVINNIINQPDLNHNIITPNILTNWRPRIPTDITTVNRDYYKPIITRITHIINQPPTTTRQTITNLPGTIKDITELTVVIVKNFVRDVQKPKPPTIDTTTSTNIINVINQMNTRFQRVPPTINFPGLPIDLTPYKPDWDTIDQLVKQLVTKQIMLPSFKRSIMVIPTHLQPIQDTITRVVTTIQQPPIINQPTLLSPLNDLFFVFSRVYFFSTIKRSCVTETTLPPTIFQSAKVTVQKVITETKVTSTPPTKNPDRFITVRRRRRRSLPPAPEKMTAPEARKRIGAHFKLMRKTLSKLVIALSDKKASASLIAASQLSEPSLEMVKLYAFVRAHQKEMFQTYQHLKGNFSASLTTLRVSITAALAQIPKNSSVISEAGILVDRQLKLSYRLVNAIEGAFQDKVNFLLFFMKQFKGNDEKLLAVIEKRMKAKKSHVPVLVSLFVLAQVEDITVCVVSPDCDYNKMVAKVRQNSKRLKQFAKL